MKGRSSHTGLGQGDTAPGSLTLPRRIYSCASSQGPLCTGRWRSPVQRLGLLPMIVCHCPGVTGQSTR